MSRVILHCDLNNFFASVECMLDPSLEGKRVAVCGSTEDRHGIVLAKNTAAKSYGVATGEAVWQARSKCPELVIVPPRFSQYVHYSRIVRKIYGRYTDRVEPFGIDECWLDVTGSLRLFGGAERIANLIREEVKGETGLTVSVGVSFNKIFAKLGSDMKKPDAVTVITRENFRKKVWPLPVTELFGVGRRTGERLKSLGIETIGELAASDGRMVAVNLGRCGSMVRNWANGLDDTAVSADGFEPLPKSIGHGATTDKDIENGEQADRVFLYLTQEIGRKLAEGNFTAGGIRIAVRNTSLEVTQYQRLLEHPTRSPLIIARYASGLLTDNYGWEKQIRSLTVTAYALGYACHEEQTDFFYDIIRADRQNRIDSTVDSLRKRYGNDCVKAASLVLREPVPLCCEETYTPFHGVKMG